MMSATVFRQGFVKPVLKTLGLFSLSAEMLMMGTAAQESEFIYTTQLGEGPALGYFQMEPVTHDDCWHNFLDFQPKLAKLVLSVRKAKGNPRASEMISDHSYATAMARIRYYRVPAELPNDGRGIAAYWKQYYNTPRGGGTVDQFISNWNRLLVPQLYDRIVPYVPEASLLQG